MGPFRFLALCIGVLLASSLFPPVAGAHDHGGFHVPLGQNEAGTSYSATITVNGRGVWIDVHAGQSHSGTSAVPNNDANVSYASNSGSPVSYNGAGSGSGSNATTNIVRSWTNAQGEPYYETTSGQVYHLAGLNIGAASKGPQGWFTVGHRQHPGSVPEALYVNGKLQSIVWVPIGGHGGMLRFGAAGGPNGSASGNTPIVIDPRVVAMDVLRHVPLPALRIRMNPSLGLVALPGWFWAEGYNGEPFGGSATIGAVTVGVQVQPTSYTWTFGDGTTLVSHDLGQPYPAQSDIQHTYQYSSLHFAHGFPVRLTVQFAATYAVNGGAAQPLTALVRTYTAQYRVQELQSILTNQ